MDREQAIDTLETFCIDTDCRRCPLSNAQTRACNYKKPFSDYTDQELEESLKKIEEVQNG